MATIARTHAPFNLSVAYKDATGQVEAPLAPPLWVSGDETLLTLAVAPDGMTAIATLSGVAGKTSITAIADGVTATLDIEIAALPIVSGEITIVE